MKLNNRQMMMMRNVLQHLAADSGASIDEGRGVLLGVVSMLIDIKNCSYAQATKVVSENMPHNFRVGSIPEAWGKEFIKL